MGRESTDLALAIDEIRLVDTHEHLRSEREWVDNGPDILQDLFGIYYAEADLLVAGAAPDAVARLLDPSAGDIEERFAGVRDAWEAARHTGYGEAVRLIASEIYGLDELTADGLRRADRTLSKLRRPGERLRLLSETARLDHVQIDHGEWAPHTDPSFFLYDISWAKFCSGIVEPAEVLRATGVELRTLEDLRHAMTAIFDRFAPRAIGVKSQHAYERTLRWEERTDDEAGRALTTVLTGGELDDAAHLVLGDWCWARGVELAIEHDLPFKLHTGYLAGAGGTWSAEWVDRVRPGNLCALLGRYPEARFVLMHMAYPHQNELVAIAKQYPNVWVDLCWAWSIDPYGAGDFLRRYLHAVPANKLFAFGGDTFWPTNAVAYSIQARRWLARTLEAEIAAGDLTERDAIAIARRLMRDNQYACFDVAGTRAACRAEVEEATR